MTSEIFKAYTDRLKFAAWLITAAVVIGLALNVVQAGSTELVAAVTSILGTLALVSQYFRAKMSDAEAVEQRVKGKYKIGIKVVDRSVFEADGSVDVGASEEGRSHNSEKKSVGRHAR